MLGPIGERRPRRTRRRDLLPVCAGLLCLGILGISLGSAVAGPDSRVHGRQLANTTRPGAGPPAARQKSHLSAVGLGEGSHSFSLVYLVLGKEDCTTPYDVMTSGTNKEKAQANMCLSLLSSYLFVLN